MIFFKISQFGYILLLTLTLSHDCFSQSDQTAPLDSLITFNFICRDSISVEIPSGTFKTQLDHYTEGFVISLLYSDASSISILCGSSAELNLNDTPLTKVFDRKEIANGLILRYQNVPAHRLAIFNEAFDALIEK